ncbi:hypothetical protein [Kitasatospora sp. NPDC057500]|uniref:hypothetical protein n=1 Tax=Kitasatospora sp. NPDC057500 TaxID=3346151 RepID=UPI0036ACEB64
MKAIMVMFDPGAERVLRGHFGPPLDGPFARVVAELSPLQTTAFAVGLLDRDRPTALSNELAATGGRR